MDTKFDFQAATQRTVYVKAVDLADLPDDIQAEVGNHKHLYAVHNAQGEQLALVPNRELAFVLARQNDYTPVTVH